MTRACHRYAVGACSVACIIQTDGALAAIYRRVAAVCPRTYDIVLLSLRLALRQFSVDFGLGGMFYRTDYTRTLGPSNVFTLLNGCTGKCVRLSRLLAFECTLNHCTFIHSFHSFALVRLREVFYELRTKKFAAQVRLP